MQDSDKLPGGDSWSHERTGSFSFIAQALVLCPGADSRLGTARLCRFQSSPAPALANGLIHLGYADRFGRRFEYSR